MPVQDVFALEHQRVAVSGRVARGMISKGDEVQVLGIMDEVLQATVIGLEAFGRIDHFETGDNAHLLFENVDPTSIQPAMVIAQPDSIKTWQRFEALLYPIPEHRKRSVFTGYKPQFHAYDWVEQRVFVACNVTVLEPKGYISPGDLGECSIELIVPVALENNMLVQLYEGAIPTAEGVITKLIE